MEGLIFDDCSWGVVHYRTKGSSNDIDQSGADGCFVVFNSCCVLGQYTISTLYQSTQLQSYAVG